MDLELFQFIDDSLVLLENQREEIMNSAGLLEQFFIKHFGKQDSFLSINSRVKSPQSFREKIIRNNLYMRNSSAESVFMNVQDLIGLRIECRFVEDEQNLFEILRDQFSEMADDGFFHMPENNQVFLKLGDSQPQLQKNGFEIYKIDGYLKTKTRNFNFELQIKSLVNVFWGEIDHRVLYKNYNYMISEDFFRDIMHSIKDSLSMIDRQLMILYDHVNKMDSSAEISNREQVKSLLSKIIHDIYVGKIYKELGFVIDFGFPSEMIVEYLYYKCREIMDFSYGENFIRLLNRINAIGDMPMDINGYIEFDKEPVFHTSFTKKVGEAIFQSTNIDFGWNLFFKIIFQVEQSNPSLDFEEFLHFMEESLRGQIDESITRDYLSDSEKEEITLYLLDVIANDLTHKIQMDHVLDSVFGKKNYKFSQIFRNINTYDDFLNNRDRIGRNIFKNYQLEG